MIVQPTGSSYGSQTSLTAMLQRNQSDSVHAAQKLLTALDQMRKDTARHARALQQSQAPHGWSTSTNATKPVPAGVSALSAADRSRGTTQPLSASDRDRVVHAEAVGQRTGVEAYTPRGLHRHHETPLVQGHAHKEKDQLQGSMTVTIPAAQARQLGLLGPHESDRSVTASMSKGEAGKLGLLPPGEATKRITASAYGADQATADNKAGLAVSHS